MFFMCNAFGRETCSRFSKRIQRKQCKKLIFPVAVVAATKNLAHSIADWKRVAVLPSKGNAQDVRRYKWTWQKYL